MAYRDEEAAADARIERLVAELAEVSAGSEVADAIAADDREAARLHARREQLEAECAKLAEPRASAPVPKDVVAGAVLAGIGMMSWVLVRPGDLGVLMGGMFVTTMGTGLVLVALVRRWRESRPPK